MLFTYTNLPLPLLALLVTALPALSGPTTPNDLFHDIAIHVPKPPEEPICCLRPLTPLEETEEEVLLTFEEWKAKRLAEVHKEHPPNSHPPSNNSHKPGTPEDIQDAAPAPSAGGGSSASAPVPATDVDIPPDRLSSHFQIPIHDRFNYASLDCSARVHDTHKSAKSASSILSSKKDRYMLSPCAEKKQFVVVELCDDIRIDTVQLANYEFFSGVFKEISVSVSKTYTSPLVPAGTFRANNTRGVQSFHPTSLTDFYRFIRIDFHSHYGNEYYCPLSLLRVYGLTHLEHWKWDMWEDESRRRALEAAPSEGISQPTQVAVADEPVPTSNGSSEGTIAANIHSQVDDQTVPLDLSHVSDETKPQLTISATPVDSLPQQLPTTTLDFTAAGPAIDLAAHLVGEPPSENVVQSPPHTFTTMSISDSSSPMDTTLSSSVHVTLDTSHSAPSQDPPAIPASSAIPSHPASSTVNTPQANSSGPSVSPQPSRPPSASSSLPVHTAHSLSVLPPATGGESIYRTIMNRLTALEANTTLYARYVEEQITGVREMMRRLGEDVGRLESISKAQAQMYQRSIVEFERHRKRLDLEQAELLARLNRLSDDVTLEQRLGVAQLCLLLAILIFMTLTRGSRGEVVHPPAATENQRSRTNSTREWGKRTLSLTGLSADFMKRFRSPTREPVVVTPDSGEATEHVKFPTRLNPPASADFPRSKRSHAANGRKLATNIHSRTPTSLRSPMRSAASHRYSFRPLTPTGQNSASLTSAALLSPRPPMQRTVSGGGGIMQSASMGSVIGPVPKSAKRWARSAHLHEVKSSTSIPKLNGSISAAPRDTELPLVSTSQSEGTGLVGDVFGEGVRAPVPWSPTAAMRKESLTMHLARAGLSPSDMSPGRRPSSSPHKDNDNVSEGDGWVDTDTSDVEDPGSKDL